jgi:hypothetical protein
VNEGLTVGSWLVQIDDGRAADDEDGDELSDDVYPEEDLGLSSVLGG